MNPLFIPLKGEYYDQFEAGTKTRELRLYGPRWNENTCPPGREVILSRGYGKRRRLRGVIGCFHRARPSELPPADRVAFASCYGYNFGRCIACIHIEELRDL